MWEAHGGSGGGGGVLLKGPVSHQGQPIRGLARKMTEAKRSSSAEKFN